MGTTDLVIAAVVLGGALLLLVRSLRRSAGGCAGCHGGCAAKPGPGVVRIGSPRPTGPRRCP